MEGCGLKGIYCSGKCRWEPSPTPDLTAAIWICQGCWFSSCKRCSLRCDGHFLKMGLWFLSSITYILKIPVGTVVVNHRRPHSQNAVYSEWLFYGSLSPLSLALHAHPSGLAPQGFGISFSFTICLLLQPPALTAPFSCCNVLVLLLLAFTFSKTRITWLYASMELCPTIHNWCWGSTNRLQMFVPL